jgi:hypothetical protein
MNCQNKNYRTSQRSPNDGDDKIYKNCLPKNYFRIILECAMKHPVCGAFSFQTANGYCLQLSKFSIISPSADYAIGFLQCQIYQGVYYDVSFVRGCF